MYIIAADVGGTKTRLLFVEADAPDVIVYEARYASADFDGFEAMLGHFIDEGRSAGVWLDAEVIETLALALPGLVNGDSARLTNLPWFIEKRTLKDRFDIENVFFLNDFQASALGTRLLQAGDCVVLNRSASAPGQKVAGLAGNATRVAVGAGTGLGLAWAEDEVTGYRTVSCSHDTEGGHIDFAPVDDAQIELLRFLRQRFDHVSYERILSGSGLVLLYQFCSGVHDSRISAEWVSAQAPNDAAAHRAMSLFVQIYGAYVGNIALLFKPMSGIFITGGIAAKIVERMRSEEFITAYLDKGRMRELVEQIPVYLVTDERVGVLGALSEALTKR